MAGRPHHRKRVVRLSIDHGLHRGEDAAGGKKRGPVRVSRGMGIGIKIEPIERGGLAHELYVSGLVTESDLLEGCLARRPKLQPGAINRFGHVDQGADSLRSFGVGTAGEMSGIRAIGHQRGLQHR